MFRKSFIREWRRICSSWTGLLLMVVVPLGCLMFFISLMGEGLPTKVPTAIVDLDHSNMSRQLTRSLNAQELINITTEVESYNEALAEIRRGNIFGFFVIPENFEEDALAGKSPTLDYFNNMTFFVPGTLSFKGFKTIAVTSAGGVIKTTLESIGMPNSTAGALVQPVVIDSRPIGNPWTNYTYYLTPSFSFAALALMIFIMTAYTITIEIKHGTSPQWLETANGHISVALAGKLLPQSLIFSVVGILMEAIMFGFYHFPMQGSLTMMIVAMILFVLANQGFALFFTSLVPNPRLSLSIVGLFGILTFSFAGLSFPEEQMYGAIGIFSYIVPTRYMFLIYINTALNGFATYFVRFYYVALLLFPLIGCIFIKKLRRACQNPVYVP